ncbi:MAG: hypothetical protein ACUVRN_07840 [Candidatus Caldatribacteriaceae bacterium]
MQRENHAKFPFFCYHLCFFFLLQITVFSFLARFFLPFLRLNLFLSLAVLWVWEKEISWWEEVAFLGLGIALDSFSFAPWGNFFFLASITLLFTYFWKEVFSHNPVSLFFVFIVSPFVELVIEEGLSLLRDGVCFPLWGLFLVKVLSIPANMFLFLLCRLRRK